MPQVPRSTRPLLVARLVGPALVALSLVGVLVVGSLALDGRLPFDPAYAAGVAGATGSPTPTPSRTPASTPSPTSSPTPPAPTPTPSPTPSPTPTPEPTPTPKPPREPFAMNLYGKNDFVSQANKELCVAGALQTMLNIMDVTNSRSTELQLAIARSARYLSKHPDGGTEPEGWARTLERRGGGDYTVSVADSRYGAIVRAAKAIRATGRPVGLLVWRGAHSWVMHGFRADADPAVYPDAKITHVYISDPWYPRVSSIWGPSRKPNALVPVAKLKEDYLPWRRPTGRYPGKDGRYVLVLPVTG